MAHHTLKCFAPDFQPIVDGHKRSTVRFNDRDFKVGDTLTLEEGVPEVSGYAYTGRDVSVQVSHMDTFGLKEGYVNLSMSRVGLTVIEPYG